MSEHAFDASGLLAQATQIQQKAQAEKQAEFRRELDSLKAQALAAPGGGAYVADGPALSVRGALPMPPGFVGALAQFIYQQAPRPVAEVAIVGALGLMAGIAGRQWHIPGSGLNLFVVLVARSAIGKEAMHTGISKIIGAAMSQVPQATNYVESSDFASGQALLKACAYNPCFVNVAGELGHKFVTMATTNDPGGASLRKVLTTLYSKSGPDSVAGGLSYSNQENNVASVQSVAFSLIGETTPGTFYESITDAMMRDGFMSRFCVIEYTGDRPNKNVALVERPPKALVDHIARIIQQAELAAGTNAYQEVAFSDDARAMLDRFEDECDAAIRAAGDDENQRAVWNRAHLNALRVAALLAVGDNHLKPVVGDEQAAWAITLMRHGTSAFLNRIRTGDIGEGNDAGREQKVMELCREFLTLPADKLPGWLKHGKAMQEMNIVPRKYLQQRTARQSAFQNYKQGHTAALNMAIKTAMTNGNLTEVKKDALVENYNFFGSAYRALCLS